MYCFLAGNGLDNSCIADGNDSITIDEELVEILVDLPNEPETTRVNSPPSNHMEGMYVYDIYVLFILNKKLSSIDRQTMYVGRELLGWSIHYGQVISI
jgi:hypothetical protein